MALGLQPPAPIRTDHSNNFANLTMRERIPKIIREVQSLNSSYTTRTQSALDALHDALQNDATIPMLALPASDYEAWARVHAQHEGDTWQNTEWFFAETYFYRVLMQTIRYFETNRDPFTPRKNEEITSKALWETVSEALETQTLAPEERFTALLGFVLWGNRIDLSHVAQNLGSTWTSDDLLIDQRREAVERLISSGESAVHIIADNAGTELACDLVFADAVLDNPSATVTLHLKHHPTFVSDAILYDVLNFLRVLEQRGGETAQLSSRLGSAFDEGRLRFAPDPYWNSSLFLWDMPAHLVATMRGASLVVLKGDANYRRLVGDAIWPVQMQMYEVAGYFPAPLIALRTMKSDPIVGLAEDMIASLDAIDPGWRVNGKRGLIQVNWLTEPTP